MNPAITIYFAQHQELFEQQLETWKKAHDEVMLTPGDVDHLATLISYDLFIFDQIIHWATQDRPTTVKDAKELCNWYLWWYIKSSELMAQVERVEQSNFSVEGAYKLQKTHQKVGTQFYTIRHLRSTITDFEEGRGRQLNDVIDELSKN